MSIMADTYRLTDLPQFGGHLSLDFANTLVGIEDTKPHDALASVDDFLVFASRNGLDVKAHPGSDEPALVRARRMRGSLIAILRSVAMRQPLPPQAVRDLGRAAQKSMIDRELVAAPGRVEWRRMPLGLESATNLIALKAVRLLEGHEAARIRQCTGEHCGWFFLDTSRNGKRRWCSMRYCGNRAKVRRHRREHSLPVS